MFVRKAPACTAKPLSALQCSQVLPKAQKESKSQRVSHRARILHNQHIDGSRPQLCTALTLQIRSEQGQPVLQESLLLRGHTVLWRSSPHYQTGLSMSMLILTMLTIRPGVPLEQTLSVRKPINVAGPLSKRSGTLMPMGSSSLSIPIPIPARYILSKPASLGYR